MGLLIYSLSFFSRTHSQKIYFYMYIYEMFVIYMLSISGSGCFHLYWAFKTYWREQSVC